MTEGSRGGFDGQKCIGYLRDRNLGFWDRLAAAESLEGYQTEHARAALFQILTDETAEDDLRDACALSLGCLWASFGIDYERLRAVPDAYVIDLLEPYLGRHASVSAEEAGPRVAALLKQKGFEGCLES